MKPLIEKVVVSPDCTHYELPGKIAQKLGLELFVMSKEELIKEISSLPEKRMFALSKRILFFTENRGSFFKKCPGSKGVLCCNYFTINSVSGCPFDCSYCILQHYIQNNPFITIFLNREKAIDEMEEFLKSANHIRVGTGELADSLALDHLLDETGFFMKAIEERGWQDRVQFEFKTKSNEVDGFVKNLKKYPGLDIVAGFSMNIEEYRQKEELYTATIDERLDALKRVTNHGAKIAIHFDPILMLEPFMEKYMTLIDKIFTTIDRDKVVWISMGGFRHTLSLSSTIRRRFPESYLLVGEMFPSDKDNKLRYLSSIRRRFYKAFKEKIGEYMDNPPLYICMEKKFIWDDIDMNISEMKKESLKKLF